MKIGQVGQVFFLLMRKYEEQNNNSHKNCYLRAPQHRPIFHEKLHFCGYASYFIVLLCPCEACTLELE